MTIHLHSATLEMTALNEYRMNVLIEKYEKVIYSFLHKDYPAIRYYDDDLVQIGRIGLWKGIKFFDGLPKEEQTEQRLLQCCFNGVKYSFWKEFGLRMAKKRQPPNGQNSSFDFIVDGEKTKKSDIAIGDIDVDWCDFSGFINSLTPRQKEIVDLLYKGYGPKEIGEIIGLTMNSVCRQKKTIRKKFEKYIG